MAYQIQTPTNWKIHNIFYVSLSSPYYKTSKHNPNFSQPPPDLIQGEEEYEVEAILNHCYIGHGKTLQYLIKWKGYPTSENSWKPVKNLHANKVIQQYHQSNPLDQHKRTQSRVNTLIAHLFPHHPSA